VAFPKRRFPRLPDTKQQLELAEQEVLQFKLPPYPGAHQTFPVQPLGSRPVRDAAAASAAVGV
jgi:hypothetical protein